MEKLIHILGILIAIGYTAYTWYNIGKLKGYCQFCKENIIKVEKGE